MNTDYKYLYFPDTCTKCNKLNPANILVDQGYGHIKFKDFINSYRSSGIHILNSGGANSEIFVYRNDKLFS